MARVSLSMTERSPNAGRETVRVPCVWRRRAERPAERTSISRVRRSRAELETLRQDVALRLSPAAQWRATSAWVANQQPPRAFMCRISSSTMKMRER